MSIYTYPTNAALTAILQDKIGARLSDLNDPLMKLMPLENVDASTVIWEQRDNYRGLMNLRGLDGQPGRVSRVGLSRYVMDPGVYGDAILVDELELTVGREPGQFGSAIDISKTVLLRQDQLVDRTVNRLKYIAAQLLLNGTFSVSSPDGSILHTDSYSVQSYAAAVSWSDHINSTPLADLRNVALKSRGHSIAFDARGKLLMNRVTFNHMIANQNPADLGRYRVDVLGGLVPMNLASTNGVLQAENLPEIEIYDEGYLDDAGTFQPFVPDLKVAAVGARLTGEPVAKFQLTRNANNPGAAPGMYIKIVDKGESEVPRQIEVHMGFNGGPAVYYPSAVVKMAC